MPGFPGDAPGSDAFQQLNAMGVPILGEPPVPPLEEHELRRVRVGVPLQELVPALSLGPCVPVAAWVEHERQIVWVVVDGPFLVPRTRPGDSIPVVVPPPPDQPMPEASA